MESIPKVIHYCWFGRKEKPLLVELCIESWKKNLTGYTFIEWNEDNFDTKINTYTDEAYTKKKFAFVSDFVRLYVLYNYGGIYLDTDTEILKPLDGFLHHEAFSGFEDIGKLPTCIIGGKKGNSFIKTLLDEYETARFIKPDGSMDLTTNVERITRHVKSISVNINDDIKLVCKGFTVYPRTYFCPIIWGFSKQCFSDDTHTIHHFAGSWNPKKKLIGKEKLKVKKQLLSSYLLYDQTKLVAIYGTGRHTVDLINNYEKYFGDIKSKLLFIVSDLSKTSNEFFGNSVISCADISRYEIDEIIISSYLHEQQMYDNLMKCSVNKDIIRRIYDKYDALVFDDPAADDVFDLFLKHTNLHEYYCVDTN